MKKYMLYIVIGVIGLLALVGLIIFIKIKQREKDQKEAKTIAMIDQMSLRREAINTAYMEDDFFSTVQSLIYSFYSQSVEAMPTKGITQELYMQWYERLKREYDLGISKQVYNFAMNNARVVKQDNSSMYAVTRIEVEADFTVDFYYSHITMQERKVKTFKQRFSFLNTNDAWVLSEAMTETDVSEQPVLEDAE